MKWDDTRPVEKNARQRLPEVLSEFYAAGREVLAHEDAATLHRFRLEGKRVRYTMELFRPVYGPVLETLLKALRKAQTGLGEINDCATAKLLVPDAHFQDWVTQRQARLHNDFRHYWLDEFDAPGVEVRWVRYLKTYARSKRASGA